VVMHMKPIDRGLVIYSRGLLIETVINNKHDNAEIFLYVSKEDEICNFQT
jgi:hypothetical protein